MTFDLALAERAPLRAAVDDHYREPESACVLRVAAFAKEDDAFLLRVTTEASRLVAAVRAKRARSGGVDALMREFSLSSDEGVALMCLAEALLRIPDAATRDALIRDKIGGADWQAHLGRSPSLFVNAASWGLLITGKLVATHSSVGLSSALARLVGRGGEPLIRKGVDLAMRMLGRQFVTGETIEEAIANGAEYRSRGYRYSYDMLGEAALTQADAERYFLAYEKAIHAIGAHAREQDLPREEAVRLGPGISVKLSALHPRYARSQRHRVMHELLARLKSLALLARRYNIGLNIDAEESERLELSLDLLESLVVDADLVDWSGLGFVVQAYQKRAPFVIDVLIDLARRTQTRPPRRLMVRLVKGAYWDSEIKRAQVEGQIDYPVYTRKVHTDVAYQACAKKLLSATDVLYPQFATHNAYTLAWVREAARQANVAENAFEFQCLHGMGETLYDQVLGKSDRSQLSCRIYAPVGTHETLLAYLVRRLLENGANSSFVNRIVDESVSIPELVADPVAAALLDQGAAHPAIPLPTRIFPDGRENSRGFDWSSEAALVALSNELMPFAQKTWEARPMIAVTAATPGVTLAEESIATTAQIRNPSDQSDIVGAVQSATAAEIETALRAACQAQAHWSKVAPQERSRLLLGCAQALEDHRVELVALAVREAGKSIVNAMGEVREAVDFCRYYASQLSAHSASHLAPDGPIVCISPWNFPLAIFTGQLVAALAAGRVVLAKPAEQTPLIAALAVRLFHDAGIPREVLQFLPGDGAAVGAVLAASPEIAGVLFTGSTEVARSIARGLATSEAERVLVAETGGQNAMIVDSSALAEQVVQDIVTSAFDSAGQRCSALRLVCLQEEVAQATLAMIQGAMSELRIGDPRHLSSDVGPVIDREAQERLVTYIERMRARGHRVTQMAAPAACGAGTFVPPTIIEIDSISALSGEVFGPVLHVLRYRFGEIAPLVNAINATGYGLTMGMHSRIDEHIGLVAERARVGNLYVNRNMVGAVVGVQPFGGEGLSGTGPKAGGPLYLARLGGPLGHELDATRRDAGTGSRAATQVTAWRLALESETRYVLDCRERLLQDLLHAVRISLLGIRCTLPGPTGETNLLWFSPRGAVGCVALREEDLISQIGTVLACGSEPHADPAMLPESLRRFVIPWSDGQRLDALLVAPTGEPCRQWSARIADSDGPLIPVIGWPESGAIDGAVPRLFHERTVSTNTAAAGGNASLMTLSD
jgi:RHH-type proline utilization regulon transcriptional repressor/proline dehydrogenase/delta 1-pyrroline-5-carboxylate dehydrogenase